MKRPALFSAWWYSATGERIVRATRRELAEANRLWWRHRDIREARAVADSRKAT